MWAIVRTIAVAFLAIDFASSTAFFTQFFAVTRVDD
jgi:hypothetical protein